MAWRMESAATSYSKKRIFMRIGRGAATEKSQWHKRPDLVPCAGGNQDRVAGTDLTLVTVDLHHPAAG